MPTRELKAYTTMMAGTKARFFCGIAPSLLSQFVCSEHSSLAAVCTFSTVLKEGSSCTCQASDAHVTTALKCVGHQIQMHTDTCWLNVSLIMSAGKYLFALCEGNFCVGGKRGKKAGNGRLIISQLETNADDNTICK